MIQEVLSQQLQNFDSWLAQNLTNYYGFLLASGLVLILGFAVTFVIMRKIGREDERTARIYAGINRDMFIALAILSMIFVSLISQKIQHIQQLYMIVLALTAVSGVVSSSIRYAKSK